MKNWTVFTVAGALFLLFNLSTLVQAQSQADKDAIKEVLLKETDSFFVRDYEAWASTFVEADQATQIWNNQDGSYTHSQGWATISKNVKAFIESHPEPNKTPLWRDNFTYRFYDDAAFVTFDKYMGDRDKVKPIKEIRVVERHDGVWKILCVAAYSNFAESAGTN